MRIVGQFDSYLEMERRSDDICLRPRHWNCEIVTSVTGANECDGNMERDVEIVESNEILEETDAVGRP